MWNTILNSLIDCCHAAYHWLWQLFGGMTENASGPWKTYFGIMCSMLACRFVFYPFLKGRVVGGIGEEIHSSSNYSTLRSVENKWDDISGHFVDSKGNYTSSRWS